MDFTRTFDANTKCNNINYVWSHFFQILVVLKLHRSLWKNIFDTDISRSKNIPKDAKYTPLMLVFMHLKMSVSKILFHRRIWYFRTTKIWKKWLQKYLSLLHLVLALNVRIKSIWTHSGGGGAGPSSYGSNLSMPLLSGITFYSVKIGRGGICSLFYPHYWHPSCIYCSIWLLLFFIEFDKY